LSLEELELELSALSESDDDELSLDSFFAPFPRP
jgi:hypothetical protein